MKKIYIEPETLIFNITLRDGVLQITSNKSIGDREENAPVDEDEIGARDDIFNDDHSIWNNVW